MPPHSVRGHSYVIIIAGGEGEIRTLEGTYAQPPWGDYYLSSIWSKISDVFRAEISSS